MRTDMRGILFVGKIRHLVALIEMGIDYREITKGNVPRIA